MEFGILGPLEVRDGGRLLDLGAPGQRALLALLLLHANQVVSTDRLAEELWPRELPKTAAKTIQVYVSALRKLFGGARGALETRGPGYLLRVAQGELDLHEFERLLERARGEEPAARAVTLRSALALWRGAPLADLAYEEFARQEVARLEELRQLAVEERIEAELALGRGRELVPELEALVAERPLQERPRAQLMLALYRSGRQSDALEVLREGKQLLDEELGLQPGERLRELERAILSHDPGLAAAPEPLLSTSVVAVPGSQVALRPLALLAGALVCTPRPRQLVLAEIVPATDLAAAGARLRDARAELARRGVTARIAAFTSATPGRDAVRLAAQQGADLLLLSTRDDPLAGPFAEAFADATCDVAALVEGGGEPADGAVVAPFGAFEHDWAALELGAWLASALDRPLQLVGAADGGPGERDASRLLADASLVLQHTTGIVAEPLLGPPGLDGLRALARGAGLLVVGLSERWRSEGLGATRSALVAAPPAPTLLVRRGLRSSGIAPPSALTRFTWSVGPTTVGA